MDCLERYAPTHVEPDAWSQVAQAVRAAVETTTKSSATARRYRSHAAAFAAWAWAEGISNEVPDLFRMELIERYIAVGMSSAADSTRATRRSILRRIARHVCPDLKYLPGPTPLPYRRVRPPYSRDEVAGYFRLARSQPTDARRQSVTAVLLLGLGCGMDCRDLGWVRGCDVISTGEAVTVVVCGGSRPRTVVCLADYEAELAELAQVRGEGLLIGGRTLGRHNVTSDCLTSMISDSTLPRLVPARLRSTWMLTHLLLDTPLPILISAAGLTTVRPLEDLLQHLPPADPHDIAARLRGRCG